MNAEDEDYCFPPPKRFSLSNQQMQTECEHPAHSVSDSALVVFAREYDGKRTTVSLQTRRVGGSKEVISRIESDALRDD